jgi:SAM-dependent methyltransferase
MHDSAIKNCQNFFKAYCTDLDPSQPARIIEIGSQDINGSLRSIAPPQFDYVGVDFAEGNGVDVVLTDPYSLPFEDESADIVISSSCFEHSEMFWIVFLEILRVLKPSGLFYLNAPSNGNFHRYPVDCWRFYPDSGNALAKWAQRNGLNSLLLESYISNQDGGIWNDFVAVFLKDGANLSRHPSRILDNLQGYRNGFKHGETGPLNHVELSEDHVRLRVIQQICENKISVNII